MAQNFTEIVRQELAHSPLPSKHLLQHELDGILRFSGVLTRHGGPTPRISLQVVTTSGAVARRTYRLITEMFGYRPELFVQKPAGLARSSRYGVRLHEASLPIGRKIGLFDDAGRLVSLALPVRPAVQSLSFLRGVILAAATFASPSREAHCEIAAANHDNATYVAAVLHQLLACHTHITDGRVRVVIKSGESIGELLGLLGASNAFMQFDEQRLRRQLRSDANRLANADNANLKRSVAASLEQSAMLRQLVERHGLDTIPDSLRQTALVRLANPHVSLRELGQLLDPPVGKAAVHRRLQQLAALFDAREQEATNG
jgi:cell division protein WhiA